MTMSIRYASFPTGSRGCEIFDAIAVQTICIEEVGTPTTSLSGVNVSVIASFIPGGQFIPLAMQTSGAPLNAEAIFTSLQIFRLA